MAATRKDALDVGVPAERVRPSIAARRGIIAPLTRLSRSLEGKVALVTGAGSGIGRATARVLADQGARIAVTDRTPEAETVAAGITAADGMARAWHLDVTDAPEVHRVVDEAASAFGGLDIVVNNAGVALFAPIDAEEHEAAWTASLDVLLSGPARVIQAALPHLRRSSDARIVNIASTEAFGATRYGSPYSAAKHGVVGLTRSLAVELGPEGITVNCVCPGPVNTGMTQDIPEDDKAVFARRRTALRRYADPEEIAHGIVSLCLPAASFITGVALPIDGGLLVRNA